MEAQRGRKREMNCCGYSISTCLAIVFILKSPSGGLYLLCKHWVNLILKRSIKSLLGQVRGKDLEYCERVESA